MATLLAGGHPGGGFPLGPGKPLEPIPATSESVFAKPLTQVCRFTRLLGSRTRPWYGGLECAPVCRAHRVADDGGISHKMALGRWFLCGARSFYFSIQYSPSLGAN